MIFILTLCCNFLLWIYSIVHCRTGSLENPAGTSQLAQVVHCRTGSLEIRVQSRDIEIWVHCYTGSREMHDLVKIQRKK